MWRAPRRPSRAPRTRLERAQAFHAFLHGRDAASLADKLLDLASRDRDVERELQQWRQLSAFNGDWAGIRRVVEDMLVPRRDFIERGECADCVARASAVLPVLRQAVERDPAAAPLTARALGCAWAVSEQADDSDGSIGDF